MSIRVMSKVWDEAKEQPSLKIVLLAIADHCDDEGVSWPGVARLAQKCNKSERQVQYDLKALEESGSLLVKRRTGRSNTSRYFITIGLDLQQILNTLVKHPQLKIEKEKAAIMVQQVVYGRERVQSIAAEKVQPIAPEPSSSEPSSSIEDKSSMPSAAAVLSEEVEVVDVVIEKETSTHSDTQPENHEPSVVSEQECSAAPQSDVNLKALRSMLADYFRGQTEIPYPQGKGRFAALNRLWWTPLLKIAEQVDYDEERAKQLVRWTIQHFDEQQLTICNPQSIAEVAVGEQAKRKRNGHSRSNNGRNVQGDCRPLAAGDCATGFGEWTDAELAEFEAFERTLEDQ